MRFASSLVVTDGFRLCCSRRQSNLLPKIEPGSQFKRGSRQVTTAGTTFRQVICSWLWMENNC